MMELLGRLELTYLQFQLQPGGKVSRNFVEPNYNPLTPRYNLISIGKLPGWPKEPGKWFSSNPELLRSLRGAL